MPKITVKDFRKQMGSMIEGLKAPPQPPEVNPIDKLIQESKKLGKWQ